MEKPRRLKVYKAVFGFHESVVASPNQAAALAAWGVRQNLFAEGQAAVTTDAKAIAAALAQPETPLRRAIGSDGPFVLEPAPPEVPKARSAAKPRKPPADRAALDAAEKALAALEQGHRETREGFDRRRRALDAEQDAAERGWAEERRAAEEAAERARRAYRHAGAKD
jgi:hypothetical protein